MKIEQPQHGEVQSEPSVMISNVQKDLLVILEEVLGRSDIGVTDDFFDLGGTSLDLIRVFERVNSKYSLSLDGSVLEDEATVARLAKCVEAEMEKVDAGSGS